VGTAGRRRQQPRSLQARRELTGAMYLLAASDSPAADCVTLVRTDEVAVHGAAAEAAAAGPEGLIGLLSAPARGG
jgi:hypothetical protein